MSREDDEALFRDAMAGVVPLRDRSGVVPATSLPAPSRPVAEPPRFIVEGRSGRAPGVSRAQLADLARGEPPFDDRLDLHRMRAAETRSAIEKRITAAAAAGARCLLVIHGRGIHSAGEPVLRDVVIEALTTGATAARVRGFTPARPRDGGEGATLVLLARGEGGSAPYAAVPRFALELEAEPADIDELGHVSNLVYLRWVLEVARAHSAAAGYDHGAYRELGVVFVVRRHEIEYLRPALEGQRIALTTWVESWKRASCVRHTEIAEAAGESVFARAATHWALVSLDTGRPVRIPEPLRRRF
jgi:acyl-CoA thioester hydrolase